MEEYIDEQQKEQGRKQTSMLRRNNSHSSYLIKIEGNLFDEFLLRDQTVTAVAHGEYQMSKIDGQGLVSSGGFSVSLDRPRRQTWP